MFTAPNIRFHYLGDKERAKTLRQRGARLVPILANSSSFRQLQQNKIGPYNYETEGLTLTASHVGNHVDIFIHAQPIHAQPTHVPSLVNEPTIYESPEGTYVLLLAGHYTEDGEDKVYSTCTVIDPLTGGVLCDGTNEDAISYLGVSEAEYNACFVDFVISWYKDDICSVSSAIAPNTWTTSSYSWSTNQVDDNPMIIQGPYESTAYYKLTCPTPSVPYPSGTGSLTGTFTCNTEYSYKLTNPYNGAEAYIVSQFNNVAITYDYSVNGDGFNRHSTGESFATRVCTHNTGDWWGGGSFELSYTEEHWESCINSDTITDNGSYTKRSGYSGTVAPVYRDDGTTIKGYVSISYETVTTKEPGETEESHQETVDTYYNSDLDVIMVHNNYTDDYSFSGTLEASFQNYSFTGTLEKSLGSSSSNIEVESTPEIDYNMGDKLESHFSYAGSQVSDDITKYGCAVGMIQAQ